MATPLNISAFQSKTPSAPAPSDEKPDWTTLDVETLSTDLRALYSDYRSAQAHANTLRLKFEAGMSAKVELADHLKLAFGYKFGKVSIAIVRAVRPGSGRAAMSLAQLIAKAG